jgi:hypothetical protein
MDIFIAGADHIGLLELHKGITVPGGFLPFNNAIFGLAHASLRRDHAKL